MKSIDSEKESLLTTVVIAGITAIVIAGITTYIFRTKKLGWHHYEITYPDHDLAFDYNPCMSDN